MVEGTEWGRGRGMVVEGRNTEGGREWVGTEGTVHWQSVDIGFCTTASMERIQSGSIRKSVVQRIKAHRVGIGTAGSCEEAESGSGCNTERGRGEVVLWGTRSDDISELDRGR